MSALRRILGLAAFELRLSLRLVRVWVFGALALLVGLLVIAHRLGIHYYGGGWSGSYAYMTKDLFVNNAVLFMGLLLSIFGIFYVFDWRHRETASLFADTLDTSSLTRLEHAVGKFLGIAPSLLAPFVLLLPFLVFAHLFWEMRVPLAVYLSSFLLMGPIFLLTPVALAFGIAGLTRSRVAAIVVPIAWVGLMLTLFGMTGDWAKVPEIVAIVLGGATSTPPIWSDFVGYDWGLEAALGFTGSFLLAALFVCLASAGNFAPSRSAADTRRRWLITAAVAASWALVQVGAATLYQRGTDARRAVVAAETAVVSAPSPTVTRRELEVELRPGDRSLSGRAVLDLRNDTGKPLPEVVFRLNAGLKVTGLDASGASAAGDPSREETVLTVPMRPPLAAGSEVQLVLDYEGGIERESIDAAEELFVRESRSVWVRNIRRFLGNVPAYLEPEIVALGTDAGWYPDPAMIFGHEYPGRPEPAFAPGTLAVRLPDGWTAASAGRRRVDADGTHRFTFEQPLPGLSLNAGPFEERSREIGGTLFRVLYHPEHSRNVEFFAAAADAIAESIEQRLQDVEAEVGLGLALPEITLVEVPQPIGGFTAGWASPNRLAAPGIVMAREGQLFGGRFEFPLKMARNRFRKETGADSGDSGGVEVRVSVGGQEVSGNEGEPEARVQTQGSADEGASSEAAPGEGAAERPGELIEATFDDEVEPIDGEELTTFDEAAAKVEIVERFVGTDWTGGDVESIAFKSAWDFRLRAEGRGAPLAGPALSSFLSELALGRPTVETPEAHRIFTSNDTFGLLIQATTQGRPDRVAGIVVRAIADMDEVYQTMLETPIPELDPREDPRTFLGVLYLKGREPLRALRDTLGRERFNAALDTLLSEHEGEGFDWEDFREAILGAARPEQRPELAVLFDNWLEGTELPGFVVTDPKARRLAGEDERWQVTATIANRGTAAGTAKLEARLGAAAGRQAGDTERSRLVSLQPGEEVEVGLVLPRKPRGWRLVPYLALNRAEPQGSFDVDESPFEAEPFEGVRPAEVLGQAQPVVVDNLDEGFTITLDDGEQAHWDDRRGEGADADEVLPKLTTFGILRKPSRWSRWRSDVDWYRPYGMFDVTAAVKRATDDGDRPARWRASLPEPGTYRVEAYLPPRKGPIARNITDEWHFQVDSAEGVVDVSIETDASEDGWNDLGRFRFGLDAEVVLRDRGERGVVVADAVRFVKESS